MSMNGGDLAALSALMERKDTATTPSSTTMTAMYTPASIVGDVRVEDDDVSKISSDAGEIWSETDVSETAPIGRTRPRFEILYSEKLSSMDAFSSSRSMSNAQSMTIRVHLPGTKYKDLELDVSARTLVVQSSIYFLSLTLPHPVDEKNGKARWDASTEQLSVTVPLVRE